MLGLFPYPSELSPFMPPNPDVMPSFVQRLAASWAALWNLLMRPFRRTTTPTLPTSTLIPRADHPISRKDISRGALHVLYGLHEAGYDAFLVGGCLRDLLTGVPPKDFDVVTNARPEEVERLFRGARVIGRRFKLVHVRHRGEIIEVATFRALSDDRDDERLIKLSKDGQILRDNVYGSIEEDALRRDFTVNALYYDIADFSLHDFADSLHDIEQRTLRLIGEPEQRYREDPVRMIRAIRFQAKLGFELDPATAAPMTAMAPLLAQVPAARLFEEVLKLFLSGHALATLDGLRAHDLLEPLLPLTATAMRDKDGGVDLTFLEAAMRNTDRRLADDKPVTPAFLFAVLLWPPVRRRFQRALDQGMPPVQAMSKAAGDVVVQQVNRVAIPRRFSSVMREIWDLQLRLPRRQGQRAAQLMEHPRFRAAYDFLLLREEAGEIAPGLGQWWTDYQDADPETRDEMAQQVRRPRGPELAEPETDDGPRRRRRRPRRRRPAGGGSADA